MNNPPYTVYYRLPLSSLLFHRLSALSQERGSPLSRRFVADLIAAKLHGFPTSSVFLSSVRDYERFIAALFSGKDAARSMTLYFRNDIWETVLRAQCAAGVDMGTFLRLILGSCCFASGSIPLPVSLIIRFMCMRSRHQYTVTMTAEVREAARSIQRRFPLAKSTLVRAAFLFFASGIGRETPLVDRDFLKVSSSKTGWELTSFRCGEDIKRRIDSERALSHASIPLVVSHTLYSFLQEII
jgi:hypothetical protein